MNLRELKLVLQKCGKLETLKRVHALATTLGLHDHQPLACRILNLYAKLGRRQESHTVFNQIHKPDIVSWTCLINLFLLAERPGEAFSIFSQLVHSGIRPDSFSIVSALSASGRSRSFLGGRAVHGMVFRRGVGFEPVVGNALIDMYGRNGRIGVARTIFSCMIEKDVSSWTSLMNVFIMCGDLDTAHQVFDEMPRRNEVSWNAMITGSVRAGNSVLALETFKKMISEGTERPMEIAVVAILSASADTGALDLGRSIHGYMIGIGLGENVTVNNALLDMYSKNGTLYMAVNIFREMKSRDVFSWSIMISAYAFHGEVHDSLEIFRTMLGSETIPNEITFVSVLSACSHAGLVLEGWEYFRKMKDLYKLEPKIEHYGCIVDLLNRAGLLKEALEFVKQMPIEPDAAIWRSLLTACIFHGDLDSAEAIGLKLLELEPDDDGAHVLLWNVHCAANNWADAVKMRKAMKERRIKKKPGCSWIEINGVVHEFLAEDKPHEIAAKTDFETISGTLKLHMSSLYLD